MQIVGKVRSPSFAAVRETIAACVQRSVPDAVAPRVVVRPLFPDAASGRRAAMFIVDVPDDAAPAILDGVIDALRCDDAVEYAQVRESFGKPIWKHQSVGNYLADMATKLQAARLLTADAAQRLDDGKRADMEAGMAKLFASEAAMEIALDAMRVHGGYGFSKEYDVERYFRDAPLMILGEGTNEIQRNVIAAQLVARSRGRNR